MCGSDWKQFKLLEEGIQIRKLSLEKRAETSTKEISDKTKELETILRSILGEIEKKLSIPENKIDTKIFEAFQFCKNNEAKVKKFQELLLEIEVPYEPIFTHNYSTFPETFELRSDKFIEEVESKKSHIDLSLLESDFNIIYRDIFQDDPSNINKINIDKLENKRQYLQYLFYLQNEESVKKLVVLIEQQKNKLIRLKKLEADFKRIIKIYKKAIKDYWGETISDIEIPFYIYSGKIIKGG